MTANQFSNILSELLSSPIAPIIPQKNNQQQAIAPQPPRSDKGQVKVPMPLAVNERYLEVREIVTDEVITVIELLSPKNKRSGDGRTAYEKKRRAILGSATHLVELDLLRGGQPMAILGMR
ncbi:DUF4058 family protein [Scytonema sp. UIC 10036]|uniref:DUF4058 family protein n=1 Tax=Scytonema sp. UIC 10036 TaxID=2304196 RepID=UPI001A9AE39A|nr:DUF4058 family protein [Scytonema sp. UIC 10036]